MNHNFFSRDNQRALAHGTQYPRSHDRSQSRRLSHERHRQRRSFLEENRDVVKRFLQAYSEATYQLMINKQKALAIYNQRLKQKDPGVVEEIYQDFAATFSFPRACRTRACISQSRCSPSAAPKSSWI
jgi:hypothetical protein